MPTTSYAPSARSRSPSAPAKTRWSSTIRTPTPWTAGYIRERVPWHDVLVDRLEPAAHVEAQHRALHVRVDGAGGHARGGPPPLGCRGRLRARRARRPLAAVESAERLRGRRGLGGHPVGPAAQGGLDHGVVGGLLDERVQGAAPQRRTHRVVLRRERGRGLAGAEHDAYVGSGGPQPPARRPGRSRAGTRGRAARRPACRAGRPARARRETARWRPPRAPGPRAGTPGPR